MDRVAGKVAIVTGAARGLGKCSALRLASEGAGCRYMGCHEGRGRTDGQRGQRVR